MPMNYGSLIASKGVSGSIANYVGYGKLDLPPILDEAQSLIYSILRCREMRTEWLFAMAPGYSQIALPDRYLDPIGRLFDVTNNIDYGHSIETDILKMRSYEPPVSGTLPNDPIFLPGTAGGTIVGVALTGVNLGQGSIITISGATPIGVNQINLNGTWPIYRYDDANTFVIDALQQYPAGPSVSGGGNAVSYTYTRMVSGSPSRWSIWDEQVKFDTVFNTQTFFKHLYYRAPALLSAANPSNWLVTRYPKLIRVATQAAAADFMKDDTEYQKGVTALGSLIQSIAAEQDLLYRGADITLDTP